MALIAEKIQQLERLITRNVGRNISGLSRAAAGNLLLAAQSIAEHPQPHVGIVTGFFIPDAEPPAPETDGPLGAVDLIRLLRGSGIPSLLITDSRCEPALKSALDVANLSVPLRTADDRTDVFNLEKELSNGVLSHLIAIERPGPAVYGRIFNMSGRDISDTTAPLHRLFSGYHPYRTIGIGDGGNEIGMGKWPPATFAGIEHGATIACRIACDFTVACGVSNWGALALGIAIALIRGDRAELRQFDIERTETVLQHLVQNRLVVDGVLGIPKLSVDGLSWPEHERLSRRLLSIALA